MKKIRIMLNVLLCSAMVFIFANGTLRGGDNGRFLYHIVKAGETVSLICIDYFGSYNPEFRTGILSDNPSIKDIDLIYPGQKLTLRNPDYSPGAVDSGALVEKSLPVTQGVVTFVEGEAVIIPKNGQAKRRLFSNTIVNPGDVIQTLAQGKVEIIINRETVLRLRERTKLTLTNFRDLHAGSGRTRVGFSLGTLWTKMKKFKDKAERFELELPTAIAGVHGTVYEATIGKDTSAEVKVFDGEVAVSGKGGGAKKASPEGLNEVAGPDEVAGPSEVSMEQWVKIVREMQRITIDKKGKPGNVEPFQKTPDDSWEEWNERRDARISEIFLEKEQ
jgi:hypothetical protein